ncbi:hypothetical protein QVD17_02541 [Tagetes erecta]|uniref:Uncharacterized protein n=1 Tax=Tagetes erecta TaxID=13708 RepID=A0AAD8P8Y3_TARER|nr:hypothetical protein QVD17_02541 [Tagetes erecta]
MKSKKIGFIFLILCAQFIFSLAFESQGKFFLENKEKVPIDVNGNNYGGEDAVKHDDLVLSKSGKAGKGTYGGQNNQPPNTKQNKAASMLLTESGYLPNIMMSVIITNIILIFYS